MIYAILLIDSFDKGPMLPGGWKNKGRTNSTPTSLDLHSSKSNLVHVSINFLPMIFSISRPRKIHTSRPSFSHASLSSWNGSTFLWSSDCLYHSKMIREEDGAFNRHESPLLAQ
ncbi:hypothetical protein FS842_008723 [Serendipita sp. 407]|nr:hypothetical protein FRC15_000046 [Serendipita sp. 397]KAG8804804.1 hypothetical protein FRC16_000058 [Serendipita sp. 398]KAG8879474.1 hypothetical protein FRC20_000046 [Serendipita sp. 405]KAG9057061.1 hypothetical protein FS842_008723 [Serendipita sp. 407]